MIFTSFNIIFLPAGLFAEQHIIPHTHKR